MVKAGSDYGIYTITIYSEKKGDCSMDVFLTDPKSTKEEKGNVDLAEYTVYPDKVPCKNYTKIIKQPESIIPADKNFEIQFALADKFNNLFEGRDDIKGDSYLTLLNKEDLNFDKGEKTKFGKFYNKDDKLVYEGEYINIF